MNTKTLAVVLYFFISCCSVPRAEAADPQTLWKCIEPDRPLHFVTSEDKKSLPPPCVQWLEIRGPGIVGVFEAAEEKRQWPDTQLFLRDIGEVTDFSYPLTAGGRPVLTGDLYRDPSSYGFVVTSEGAAPPGAIVLYGDRGAILVETRESPTSPWKKKVLLPAFPEVPGVSTAVLRVDDLYAPSNQPKILVRGPIG